MSEKIFSIVKQNRTCGDCTKCCEGWLTGEIHGFKMYPGRPCHFVGEGCCSIYNERPETPCKTFSCAWKENVILPEWLRPDKSNVILVLIEQENFKYVKAIETDFDMSSPVLSYIIDFCVNKGVNLTWVVKGQEYHLGSKEFLDWIKK